MSDNVWRKCGSCKKDILYNGIYQRCSVSSCHKLAFCSVDCWDHHVPVMNHKSAWAEEENAPPKDGERIQGMAKKIMISGAPSNAKSIEAQEILIVASKLKDYVKNKHGLNTSGDVMEKLSAIVRVIADQACDHAKSQGRKTLMDRDFQ